MGRKNASKKSDNQVKDFANKQAEPEQTVEEVRPKEKVEMTPGEKKLQRELEKRQKEEEEMRKREEKKSTTEKNKQKPKTKKSACNKTVSSSASKPLPDKKPEINHSSSSMEDNFKDISLNVSENNDIISKTDNEQNTSNNYNKERNVRDKCTDNKSYHNFQDKTTAYNKPNRNTEDRQYGRNYRINDDRNQRSDWHSSDNRNTEDRQYGRNYRINDDRNQRSDWHSSDNRNYNNSRNDNRNTTGDHRYSRYNSSDNKWQNSGYRNSQYDNRNGCNNVEFQKFKGILKSGKMENANKIKEEFGDLFDVSDEISLAHCVAEDLLMGAGIAVEFRKKFKGIGELYNQNVKEGGVAILKNNQRYIYYLITKERSSGKPTLYTLWKSLHAMRDHIQKNNVKKLAMPQIGCGLDRLNWPEVKTMLEYIFKNDDIEIVIYSLTEEMLENKGKPRKYIVKITHQRYPLIDIEAKTGLLYFGSEDAYITPEIKSLNTKYPGLELEYKTSKKILGNFIRTVIKGEVLYGLIIKKSFKDEIDFIKFEECCNMLKKMLITDGYNFIGIQGMHDENNPILFDKMLNIMSTSLSKFDLYVCWPNELSSIADYYFPTSSNYQSK